MYTIYEYDLSKVLNEEEKKTYPLNEFKNDEEIQYASSFHDTINKILLRLLDSGTGEHFIISYDYTEYKLYLGIYWKFPNNEENKYKLLKARDVDRESTAQKIREHISDICNGNRDIKYNPFEDFGDSEFCDAYRLLEILSNRPNSNTIKFPIYKQIMLSQENKYIHLGIFTSRMFCTDIIRLVDINKYCNAKVPVYLKDVVEKEVSRIECAFDKSNKDNIQHMNVSYNYNIIRSDNNFSILYPIFESLIKHNRIISDIVIVLSPENVSGGESDINIPSKYESKLKNYMESIFSNLRYLALFALGRQPSMVDFSVGSFLSPFPNRGAVVDISAHNLLNQSCRELMTERTLFQVNNFICSSLDDFGLRQRFGVTPLKSELLTVWVDLTCKEKYTGIYFDHEVVDSLYQDFMKRYDIERYNIDKGEFETLVRDRFNSVVCGDNEYALNKIDKLIADCFWYGLNNLSLPAPYRSLVSDTSGVINKDPIQKLTFGDYVGIENVKTNIMKIINSCKLNKLRQNKGINPSEPFNMHMVFKGNPGTAKTTTATIIAKMLHADKVISSPDVKVLGRGDLVGQYVGHTAKKTADALEDGEGGVILIDEAYSLTSSNSGVDFGAEAISTIVEKLEYMRGDTIVIFAGYPKEMEEFIRFNPGIRSRIGFELTFDNYSEDELVEIAHKMAERFCVNLSDGCDDVIREIVRNSINEKDFGNARFIRKLIENTIMNQSTRLINDKETFDDILTEELQTILPSDITDIKPDNITLKNNIGFGV